jgi:hypothetical protein
MIAMTLPIAARIDPEVVQFIVVVVILALAGIGRLLAALNPPGRGAARPVRPAPPDAADEIDAFLQRGAVKRQAAGGQPVPAPAPRPLQAEVLAPRPEKPVRAKRAAARVKPSQPAAAPAAVAVNPADALQAPPAETAAAAPELLQLLASPESLSQAIMLNEILHRPEERWQ